jgi:hypothetical protein
MQEKGVELSLRKKEKKEKLSKWQSNDFLKTQFYKTFLL